MQILSAAPLVDKFKSDSFEQSEVGPYFMAQMVLTAMLTLSAFGVTDSWDIAAALASVVITVFGVLYLKRKNRDTFGNQFVEKYFCLGWVIWVRMLLLSIPVVVAFFALAIIVGGNDAIPPAGALLTIGLEILFYWWLGELYSQCHPLQSEQSGA